MDLCGPKGVIVNKLEETVKMYGHKVLIETALESRISFITLASEINLAISSVESCLPAFDGGSLPRLFPPLC